MTTEGGKPKRRGFKLEGQAEADSQRAKVRDLADALRLERDAPAIPEGQKAYDPNRLEAFLRGYITLGDLEGITKQEQYQIAELGYSYLGSGKLAQAKTVFEGLLALDPFDAYFNMCLGSIAQQENRHAEAEESYTRALKFNPFSPTGYANRGEVRVLQGKLLLGAEDLIKAMQLDPNQKEPATQRAKATLLVLREQLGAIDPEELKKRAAEATESKVKAAAKATSELKPAPRPQPTAKPRAAAPGGAPRGSAPGPRRPTTKK